MALKGGSTERNTRPSSSDLGHGGHVEDDKYLFGTETEILNRNATGYGADDPGNKPPHFVQIPGGNSGKNLNEPSLADHSGKMKWSKGV